MTIDRYRATIDAAMDDIRDARQAQRDAIGRARGALRTAATAVERNLTRNEQELRDIASAMPPVQIAPWTPDGWRTWEPELDGLHGMVRTGQLREDRSNVLLALSAGAPLIGGGGIVVRSRPDTEAQGDALLRSLLLRIACALPHHARFLLLDPSGLGENYRHVKQLPGVLPADRDTRRSLDEVIDHIRHVNRTYLDGAVEAFHHLPDAQRRSEDFRFVVCADIPRGYDLRAIEALRTIAETGPRAGVYLLMHEITGSQDVGLPFTPEMAVIDLDQRAMDAFGIAGTIEFDGEPPPELATDLLRRLEQATPDDVPVDWRELQPPTGQWWSQDSIARIEAPIGTSGVADPIRVTFGVDRGGTPVVHGILAATSGGGKSTFFHNLIAGLAVRYPPEELRLFLVDGKFGTEFARYADLPHADVVSLHTNPEVARSLLTELVDEMGRRNERFRRGGTSDLQAHRERTGERIPRILMIADEFQQLFEDDEHDVASDLLVKLSEQGRSAGIHLLLASQGFQAKGMRRRADLMRNVHLRIAMMMSPEELRAMSEFDPEGRRLIATTCDQVGKLVLNDRSGADGSNRAGRAALLLEDDDAELRRAIAAQGHATEPIVLDGDRQPEPVDLLPFTAKLQGVGAPAALQELARSPILEGGFGNHDWLAADRPLLLPCGRELTVRGQVAATLARGPDANLLLVGDDSPVRVGMLAMMCGSLAALSRRGAPVHLVVADLSRDGTDWYGLLPDLLRGLIDRGAEGQLVASEAEAATSIQAAVEELRRRQALGDREALEAPSRVLLVHDADRIGPLAMVHDDFGPEPSPLGRELLEVLQQGPRVGVHVVLSIASMGSLRAALPDRAIAAFRHRAGLQMSEDDAFALMTDPTPARLQRYEPPKQGAYLDTRRGVAQRFVPPSLDADASDPAGRFVRKVLARLDGSR